MGLMGINVVRKNSKKLRSWLGVGKIFEVISENFKESV
jgi:hypothetical protein